MSIKKPFQDNESIQGGNKPIITDGGYDGYIPPEAFTALSWELAGLVHGEATLKISIKDGNLNRYVTSRERSFVPGKQKTGGNNGSIDKQ